jgi:uncharacterized protein (TIGR03545 family)
MAVDGVRFGTPRTSSGEVAKKKSDSAVSKALETAKASLPTFNLPDVNEILAKESLESLKLAETLKADLQTGKDTWQKQVAALPNKDKLNDYKKRIEGLKSAGKGGLSGILGGANEVLAVQQELAKDVDRIKQTQQRLESDLTQLRKRMDEAAKAPQQDFVRLRDKYSLSPQGLFKVSGLFLEGPIMAQTQRALAWYERLQPLLARTAERKGAAEVVKPVRGKGVDVRFKERAPLPDFLIRTAQVGLVLSVGNLNGQVRNITPDQPVLGQPLTFSFKGDKLEGVKTVALDGEFNRVNPAEPKDSVSVKAQGYKVQEVTLSDSKDLPLALKDAQADFSGQAALRGKALNADLSASLHAIRLAGGASENQNQLAKAVTAALADVRATNLKATVTGTLDQYDVQLTTDLDRVLSEAVAKQMQAQLARLEGELKSAILAKARKPLEDLNAQFGDLLNLDKELTARLQEAAGIGKGQKESPLGGFKLPF